MKLLFFKRSKKQNISLSLKSLTCLILSDRIIIDMYELTFLVNPNISEEDLADVVKQLRDSIARAEGKITKDFFRKRINLAYPVKKLRQAFFITVEFEIDRDKLDSVRT